LHKKLKSIKINIQKTMTIKNKKKKGNHFLKNLVPY